MQNSAAAYLAGSVEVLLQIPLLSENVFLLPDELGGRGVLLRMNKGSLGCRRNSGWAAAKGSS